MKDSASHTMRAKKVLVVRFSSIGDIVLTSPIVRALKLQLDCEVHFVTKGKFSAVVSSNPRIDKLYTFEKEITEILTELKIEQYDYIVDLHKNLRSKRLIFVLGAKSINFHKINFAKWLRVHTRLNILPKNHLVDRYYQGVSPLGIHNDGEGLEFFHGLSKSAIDGVVPAKPYCSVVLGATYLTKRIPFSKLELIIKNTKLPVVLLGGSDVISEANLLENANPEVINQVGKLSLQESAALVENSQFIVTGDTGMMHIAAAFKVPTIVFWGSTAHELGMYPYYGENHKVKSIDVYNPDISCSPCSKIGKDRCPKGHFKCMLDLKDEAILNALKEIQC